MADLVLLDEDYRVHATICGREPAISTDHAARYRLPTVAREGPVVAMEIIIVGSAREAAIIAADCFEHLLSGTDRPVIGLATGNSPLPTYRELIERYRNRRLSFARTRVFLLDEYVGLDQEHPQSCRSVIRRELLDHVDAPEGAMVVPECVPPDPATSADATKPRDVATSADVTKPRDPATSADAYERCIADAGGIDLQLLGIGRNGHIGFNEPPSSLGSRTRLTTLASATRKDNAHCFDHDPEKVPRQGITQGVGTILDSRHAVLLATGEAKSEAIARAVEGPVTAMLPASALQLHPRSTIIVDEAAGQLLVHADCYREAYRNKSARHHI